MNHTTLLVTHTFVDFLLFCKFCRVPPSKFWFLVFAWHCLLTKVKFVPYICASKCDFVFATPRSPQIFFSYFFQSTHSLSSISGMFSKLYTQDFFEAFADATKSGFGSQEVHTVGSLVLQMVGNEPDMLKDVLAITDPQMRHPKFDQELYNVKLDNLDDLGPIPLVFDHTTRRLVGPEHAWELHESLPVDQQLHFGLCVGDDNTAHFEICIFDPWTTLFQQKFVLSRQHIIKVYVQAVESLRAYYGEKRKRKLSDKQTEMPAKKHRSG